MKKEWKKRKETKEGNTKGKKERSSFKKDEMTREKDSIKSTHKRKIIDL